ncbi:MAG: YwaF family protein [Clostridia bacterium]|nr:YwaF family protein [Clostridia bacterium]
MEFWKGLLAFFEAKMGVASSYGWFHIFCVGLAAAFTVFMCIRFRDCSDKTLRRISLIIFVTLVLFDIYKQIVFDWVNYDPALDAFVWDYNWYSFPFQLCSTPHFVLPFIIWCKDGKLRDACIGYMTMFSLIGGAAVLAYPESCLTYYIGANIQTMLHHSMQVFLGIFYAVNQRKKYNNIMYYVRSSYVFLTLLSVAMILNVVVNEIFIANGIPDVFNMFYISPYHTSSIPVFSELFGKIPYAVYLGLYIVVLLFGGFVIYYTASKIISYKEKKK